MGLQATIDSQIIIADPNPNIDEFEKSLSSRFGQMILKAEELFGNRDMSYILLGFEFISNGQHIYHLGPEQNKQILIHLPTYAQLDYTQCLYMLSHEAFHCLGPNRNIAATRLEEGLATYFAKYYMNYIDNGSNWNSTGQNYRDAMADTEKLFAFDPEIIKKARAIQTTISLITKFDLINLLPKYQDINLIDRLLINFT